MCGHANVEVVARCSVNPTHPPVERVIRVYVCTGYGESEAGISKPANERSPADRALHGWLVGHGFREVERDERCWRSFHRDLGTCAMAGTARRCPRCQSPDRNARPTPQAPSSPPPRRRRFSFFNLFGRSEPAGLNQTEGSDASTATESDVRGHRRREQRPVISPPARARLPSSLVPGYRDSDEAMRPNQVVERDSTAESEYTATEVSTDPSMSTDGASDLLPSYEHARAERDRAWRSHR